MQKCRKKWNKQYIFPSIFISQSEKVIHNPAKEEWIIPPPFQLDTRFHLDSPDTQKKKMAITNERDKEGEKWNLPTQMEGELLFFFFENVSSSWCFTVRMVGFFCLFLCTNCRGGRATYLGKLPPPQSGNTSQRAANIPTHTRMYVRYTMENPKIPSLFFHKWKAGGSTGFFCGNSASRPRPN